MKSRRGKVFGAGLSALVVIGAIVWIFIPPPPPEKECLFSQDSVATSNTSETAVIFAPTANFVDMSSITARAATSIKSELGSDLLKSDDRVLALGRGLSLVVADGDPQLVSHKVVKVAEGANEEMDIERAIDSVYGNFNLAANCSAGDLKKADDQIPTSSQSDMLKALFVASDQVTNAETKTIYVLGNGIQTSGSILMQEEGTLPSDESEAKELARELYDRNEIPDLTGITVNWYGMGQVDGDLQKPLPLTMAKALESFWTEVVELGGGAIGEVCGQCGSGLPHINSIPVDLVPVNECPITVKLYDSDGVEFKPDSSDFVDSTKAKAAARKTVTEFKSKKGCSSLTIRGIAAAGVDRDLYIEKRIEIDETNLTLTKLRAQAFGKLLKDAGFSGPLTFVGGGTCGTEWSSKGIAVSDLQKICRRVEVY